MRLGALWRACHPGPTLMVTAVAAVLAIAAGRAGWQVAVIVAAVLCGQLSVGWSNDAIDASRDVRTRRADKPVVTRAVPVRMVAVAALSAGVLCVPLSLALGPAGWWHVLAVAVAWTYNHPLKKTSLSVLPFAVSFGLLVVFVVGRPTPALIAAAAVLGAAAHFANVLPDLDDDAETGVRGLPHRLSVKGSRITAAMLLFCAALLASSSLPTRLAAAVVVMGAVLAGVAVLAPPSRWIFRAVMAAAGIDVAALLLAVGTSS